MSASPPSLKAQLARMAPEDGTHPTAVPGLTVFRESAPSDPFAVEYRPCLCVVGQGRKRVSVGERTLEYDPEQFLVVALPLPVSARIVEASRAHPLLVAVLEIDVAEVGRLLMDMPAPRELPASAAVRVSSMDPRLTDAVARLLRAAEDATEARVLGPGLVREVLFRVLEGDQGDALRHIARRDGQAQRVARAIRFVERHYHEPIDVASIARSAGLSPSRLQHVFKDVTALSPIQYLKRLRLHRARLLMIGEGLGAGEAAFRVGYASPSQFSREFKRQFGLTPSRAVREMQEE